MRVLLSAALLLQAIALLPAHADDGSRHATFARDKTGDLEKTFWVCDYAGTNGMVDTDQVVVCIAITAELKRMKFEGDFGRLLAWWNLNKVAHHHELDRASIAAIERAQASSAT